MDDAQRGAKALAASDFPSAITHYTRALLVNPHATDYYIKRSTAYTRLKPADGGPNGSAALSDAEMAVALGIQRARREQILAGQMRRAVALYQLERFGDAAYVFGLVRGKVGAVPEKTSQEENMASALAMGAGGGGQSDKAQNQELQIWEIKVKGRLGKLKAGDEKATVTVKEVPDVKVPEQEELRKIYQAQLEGADTGLAVAADEKEKQEMGKGKGKAPAGEAKQPSTSQVSSVTTGPAPSQVRHEWYQSADKVVITIYAKGVPKDKADIEIQESSLSVSFPLSSGSDYSFNLEPLFAPVDPSTSSFSMKSTKIEVILGKKQAGQKWSALEGSSPPAADNQDTAASTAPTITPRPPTTSTSAPSYPTSSRTGTKDWDKLATTLTRQEKQKSTSKKGKEKNKKKEKDASGEDIDVNEDDDGAASDDSDYGSGDPVDSFFKKIYAKSDPDTRRAMMKSYYESEGTALSTNWSEVGKGKVEVKPPSDD
ncbi:hypothetical protein AJ80_07689 [Polytolypa hystricis UAMH7299]|uniref:SGT1 and CS domain-containing protein n=1 Tax=Polytolypa hystricis (strain UAMH7299) TaxID=1447883 RepID=A0A2B7XCN1_POLH7|nr:hypothetical protein AJ80_07689 [Polytolypa hystricis UAMH7299]